MELNQNPVTVQKQTEQKQTLGYSSLNKVLNLLCCYLHYDIKDVFVQKINNTEQWKNLKLTYIGTSN